MRGAEGIAIARQQLGLRRGSGARVTHKSDMAQRGRFGKPEKTRTGRRRTRMPARDVGPVAVAVGREPGRPPQRITSPSPTPPAPAPAPPRPPAPRAPTGTASPGTIDTAPPAPSPGRRTG